MSRTNIKTSSNSSSAATTNTQVVEDGYSTPPPRINIEDLSMQSLERSVRKTPIESKTWENCFESNLAIGEFHSDLSPKRFLIENMELLKREGYKVIFLEHIAQSEFKESLEQFFETKVMPENLKEKLAKLDFGHLETIGEVSPDLYSKEYNFTNLVKAAVENGIKVIGLEISEEIWRGIKAGKNRMAILNENARSLTSEEENKFAQKNLGEKLKWICFVGSGHLKTYEGVPGICDVVDAQDILISDCQRLKASKMVLDEKTKPIYPDCQLPIDASMAITWPFDQEMSYDKIMEFREQEISNTKIENYKSSSDSESESGIKRKYEKELQEPHSQVTNPAKRARKLKSKHSETVLEK